MVVTSVPSAWTARQVHDFDGDAVDEHRARAALAGVATDLGAGQAAEIAEEVNEQLRAARPRGRNGGR